MSLGVDQALCMPNVQINTHHPGGILTAQGRNCDAIEPLILVGNDEAAFVIVVHADPGTLLIPGNRVEQFNVESRQHMHGSRIGYLRLSSFTNGVTKRAQARRRVWPHGWVGVFDESFM